MTASADLRDRVDPTRRSVIVGAGLLSAVSALAGCTGADPTGSETPHPDAEEPGEAAVAGDSRKLVIGRTILYLPRSWLFVPGGAGRGADARWLTGSEFVEPPFAGGGRDDREHHLEKGVAKFGRGLGFQLVEAGSRPEALAGVDARSAVYELSLLHYPSGDRPMAPDLLAAIAAAPDRDGWAQVEDRYYDRRSGAVSPADAFAIPVASDAAAGDPNFSRFRYDADLVVRYRWHRPGTAGFDAGWVRRARQDVVALIRWLATPPTARNQAQALVVGGPAT